MRGVSLEEALDGRPVGAGHRRVLWLAGFGWAFDAMDLLLVGYAVVAIAGEFGLTQAERGAVISAGFVGMLLGAAAAGTLADRYGRRPLMMIGLLVYALATGLTALAGGIGVLLLMRFVTGLGLGGELPVASTLVSEVSPAKSRGRQVVLLESFWAVGAILAALIGFLVVSTLGWRWAFAIGALPALYVFVLRRGLPESPRWLARKGRVREAREAAALFGVSGDVRIDGAGGGAPGERVAGPRVLWSAAYRRRTFMLWVLWFGMVFSYYGIFTWLPGVLVDAGYGLARGFGFALLITLAQVPGYFSAAYLVERWGRKATLVTYLLGSAVAALLFGLRGLGAEAPVAELLLWGSLVSFFNLGAWGVVYGYTPELYPTAARASGAGWAAGFGRAGGIAGPYLVGVMLGPLALGVGVVFAVFAAVLLVIALDVLLLGEETKGRSLAEISEGPARAA